MRMSVRMRTDEEKGYSARDLVRIGSFKLSNDLKYVII